MGRRYADHTYELIKGAYDLHTHTAPSHVPRSLSDVELLQEASAVGMAGVMLKSHYDNTQGRAMLCNLSLQHHTKAFGSVTLNYPVGGLNPYAVESVLRLGASMVWMPTRDSCHSLRMGDMPGDFFQREGISILKENGHVKDAVYDIIDVTKKYNATLATGHLSPEESVALCQVALDKQVKIVLTHPDWCRTIVPFEEQLLLAKKGVLIEKVWATVEENTITREQMARDIRKLPSDRVFMVTDRGQVGEETPTAAMMGFIEEMLALDVDVNTIRRAVTDVPEYILNI